MQAVAVIRPAHTPAKREAADSDSAMRTAETR